MAKIMAKSILGLSSSNTLESHKPESASNIPATLIYAVSKAEVGQLKAALDADERFKGKVRT
jgi:hypothetical protein